MKSAWSNVPAAAAASLITVAASAQISDLTHWTLLEDPPNALMNASVTPGTATLTAGNGVISSGTDIGYASVNGPDVANSTAGFYFDPGSDFLVAIDFDLTFADTPTPVGGLAVGFGVGEDVAGSDSAGYVSFIDDATTGARIVAARDNDVLVAGSGTLSFNPLASGSMFIAYAASTGSITTSYSVFQGDNTPGSGFATATFTGLQDQWDDEGLLLSFFLRSDALFGTPWSAGDAAAAFSNFRVLDGEAIAVPEPASALLLVTAGTGLLLRRRA